MPLFKMFEVCIIKRVAVYMKYITFDTVTLLLLKIFLFVLPVL